MVDIDLLSDQLRRKGHTVEHAHPLPDNAGDYQFSIDGQTRTLAEARAILEADQPK